ncbi:calcium-binding protein, partial [Nitrosomonas sp. JL21]|nr:calcium-binding protein [Nitrosomonas sp. JL21]
MDNKQLDILQTINLMFRAAAGEHYLNEFMGVMNDSVRSIQELAGLLAQTEVFQQRYPDTLSNAEFSLQLVENAVNDLVDAKLKVWASSEIEHLLNDGMSRGDVIYWAAKALAAVTETDPQWGAAARQFDHQVEISAFYSIDLHGAATSVSVLQRVAALVDEDPASVAMAKKILTSGVAGTVIDGYVRGAQVFADLNGDQQLNEGESSTVTDATGHFSLPAVTGFGDLIASGGVDIATGKSFEGIMTAPAGSSVINPLTTIISRIIDNDGVSAAEAAGIVLAALGLDDEIDLLHFDPINAVMSADTAPMTGMAMAAHAAAVKIEVITGQVAALLQGIGITDTEASAISFAYQALASLLASESNVVDLSARSVITLVIQDATLLAGADGTESSRMGAVLADASRTIGNFAQTISALSTSGQNKKTILSKIAAVQIVAETLEGTMQSGAAQGDIGEAVKRTTGAQFTKSITAAAARVGDVNGDGKSDALPSPPSSGGGPVDPPVTTHYLPTNATSFSGTAVNDTLSISTAASWTPLVMTAVVLDGGTGNNTMNMQDGSSIAAATVVDFQNLTFDATGHTGLNTITMSAAQNQAFTGTITAPGTGVNSEEITIVGDGALTTLANVENYTIADDSTDARTITISQANTNVTAASTTDAVTFNAGAQTYTGTITGESSVDDILSLDNGADVSGSTIANVEALTLASGASIRLSAAQNQGFTGAIAAPGTGVTGETITIVGDGAVTTLTNVENYTFGDDSTNARTVAVSQANTNVTAASNTDAVTVNVGVQTYTGTIIGESTVDDTLSMDNNADVSGGTIANVEALTLALGASVRLTAAQNQGFTGAITAPGTDVTGEEITIVGDGAVTTLANVENYSTEDDSTNARTVTISQANTNVTAVSATDAVTFAIGAQTYTGAISGEATVEDTLSLNNNADVSGSTVANVKALTLASGASVRLSVAQNQGFSGTITAPGTGIGGETVMITGDGAVTTLANVENYAIEDDTTNARVVTISQVNTNVTAASTTDAVTFNAGAQTYTGTITGESTVDDILSLDNGADVSGSTIANVEALTLTSGASVRLSAAQ